MEKVGNTRNEAFISEACVQQGEQLEPWVCVV